MIRFGAGHSVARTEDFRFLTGRGRYTDDLAAPNQVYLHVVRSPHAHARVRAIDATAAAAVPGVDTILTGADVASAGFRPIPCLLPLADRAGNISVTPPYPILAHDKAAYAGQPVAAVVATSLAAAQAGAEALAIDYDLLPAVVDTATAADPGQPTIWDEAPANVCFRWEDGDRAATAAAFAAAAHTVEIRVVNNRVAVHPMEPRAVLARYDAATDSYTVTTPTQGVFIVQRVLAEVLNVARERVRVISPDIGGGFGAYFCFYPEHALAAWAARLCGRPIKWTNDRSSAFVSDTQGRDHVTRAALAFDADGRFRAIRVDLIAAMGAFCPNAGPAVPVLAPKAMQTGVYRIAAAYVAATGVFTNTVPVDAYRGAGNPETHYVLERLVDAAARLLGLAPAEIRRRNMVPAADLPYRTALGQTYDSGDFAANLTRALALADAAGFPARRHAAAECGRYRGLGLANHIKPASGSAFGPEAARIRIERDGGVTLLSGSQSMGQGHETAYAQMIASYLGVPFERVQVRQGDTATTAEGHGTSASRSMVVGGTAMRQAMDQIVAKARPTAADLLEAAAADLEFAAGDYRVIGTDRRVAFVDVAAALGRTGPGDGDVAILEGEGRFRATGPTFPNGCHVCEVEIDPETGAVALIGYWVADDYGRVINPRLLEGQVHGGVAQGIGQALMENVAYDPTSGQLLAGTLMDYALPRAEDIPPLAVLLDDTHPCTTNVLGVKGGGESGCVGALPAVVNAILDALAPLGVRHIDMPAAPARVWAAIAAAKRGAR
jgi:carbon-monoxide dehydrogenase large subunit